jgi:probable F420-dependent oxidoreductase
MRIGITVDNPDSVVDDARRAEELGFDLLGCGEHLFFHGPTPNSFTMLAAAAAVTERIRLVSSIALLPLYPPAVVAKMASVIDRMSRGRFELGVGAGGEFPREFTAAGVDPASRFRRTSEGLEVLRRLFSADSATFTGRYSALDGVRLDPPPVQPGGPPIWLGGRKPGALRRAGRYADIWMPYLVDPGQVRRGIAEVRSTAEEYGRNVAAGLFAWTACDDDGDWARRVGVETVSTAYQQDFSPLADRYLLLGRPDEVVARLREFADTGVESVLLQAAGSPDDRTRILESLSRDVLPALWA